MKVKRKYNNNVILSVNKKGNEVILVGRGLGFGLKPDDEVDRTKIEKTFQLEKSVNRKFTQLIQDIPLDTLLVCEEVISFIKKQSDKEIDDSIYVSLTDHLVTMVDRIRKGVIFDGTLLLNMRSLYPAEYKIAVDALDILRERFDMDIDQSEADFITLHIVNAQTNSNIVEMYEIANAITDITDIVKGRLIVDTNTFAYERFLTHCRFFVQRIFNKEVGNDNHVMYRNLVHVAQSQYKKQLACVEAIAEFVEDKYAYHVSEDERMFLLLHVVKLTS